MVNERVFQVFKKDEIYPNFWKMRRKIQIFQDIDKPSFNQNAQHFSTKWEYEFCYFSRTKKPKILSCFPSWEKMKFLKDSCKMSCKIFQENALFMQKSCKVL